MSIVGTVESLWRYPVKSMAGEAVPESFIGYAGVYGDRIYGFLNSASPAGAPFLTGRDRRDMLLYRPQFRDSARLTKPPNQSDAEGLGPGLTPVYASPSDFAVDVQTPSGQVLAVSDPTLLAKLTDGLARGRVSFVRSDRAMTDCRPISLISLQTIQQLGDEVGLSLDKRRFRSNIYVRLTAARSFAEDEFVGRKLQIGLRVVVAVLIRDGRCKMITIDPETAHETPAIMRNVARAHGGHAGVYCAVLTEGVVRVDDSIVLLD